MATRSGPTSQGSSDARPVQAAIAARATVRRFRAEPVPRETLRRLLHAAVQAPNHRRTRPWRFFVLDRPGAVRDRLADLAFEAARNRAGAAETLEANTRARAKRDEIVETPVLFFVFSIPGRHDEETRENYAATACAVENLLLAATEEGLGCGWSTGGVAKHPHLRETIGAEDDWELVGVIYAGYPEPGAAGQAARPPADEVTRWLAD